MLRAASILQGDEINIEPQFRDRLEQLVAVCRETLPSVDEERLRRAFRISYWAHRNDRRHSGEMYIAHPLEVAFIVAQEIAIDDVTVVAALLHDVVEDTEISLEFVKDEFGTTIANIIDGLTKISGVPRPRTGRERPQAHAVDGYGHTRHPGQVCGPSP